MTETVGMPLAERLAAYKPGEWFEVASPDEAEAFYLSRLPAIRAAARELGYAIGLHGSMRRDFDLIAAPWVDDPAPRDQLARAIQNAACGITMTTYTWNTKPLGRLATSLAVFWPEMHPHPAGFGHIDLSVMPGIP